MVSLIEKGDRWDIFGERVYAGVRDSALQPRRRDTRPRSRRGYLHRNRHGERLAQTSEATRRFVVCFQVNHSAWFYGGVAESHVESPIALPDLRSVAVSRNAAFAPACIPTAFTCNQTIGRSTRNTIGGDSTTSYPILSVNTGEFVDQTPTVRPRLTKPLTHKFLLGVCTRRRRCAWARWAVSLKSSLSSRQRVRWLRRGPWPSV